MIDQALYICIKIHHFQYKIHHFNSKSIIFDSKFINFTANRYRHGAGDKLSQEFQRVWRLRQQRYLGRRPEVFRIHHFRYKIQHCTYEIQHV